MNNPEGSRQRPPTKMEEPNPYPAAAGVSTKLAVPMSTANSAKPTASEAMLVSSSAGRALTAISTTGEASRRSTRTNTSSSTTDAASRPIVLTSPQPQTLAWESGSSSAVSATASSSAPGRSNFPCPPAGGSGTRAMVPARVTAPPATQIQNSTW